MSDSTDVRDTREYSKPMRLVPTRGYWIDDRGERVVIYLPPIRVTL